MREEGSPPPLEKATAGRKASRAGVTPGVAWAAAFGLGAAWACVFVFAFPGGALSTLMHEVLGLPGPGAGIALVLGPFLAMGLVLFPTLLRRPGTVLASAAGFGLAVALCRLAGYEGVAKGAFGSPLFVAGVLAAGSAGAIALYWRPRALLGAALAGPATCLVLSVWYWLLIFPRTAGWVRLEAAALLAVLGAAAAALCGVAAASLARHLASLFPGETTPKNGGTHVRPR